MGVSERQKCFHQLLRMLKRSNGVVTDFGVILYVCQVGEHEFGVSSGGYKALVYLIVK